MTSIMDWIDANVSEIELIACLLIAHLGALSLALYLDNRAMRRDQKWRRGREL